MTTSPADRIGEDATSEAAVVGEANALFERLGDWGLGRLMELARKEMERRLAQAERNIAEMKRHFRFPEPASPQAMSSRKSKKSTKKKFTSSSLTPKATSGARGKLKSTILATLFEKPKTRAEIDQAVKENGLPTKSVATTLTRMKKYGIIHHDDSNRTYILNSLNEEKIDAPRA